MQLQIIDPQRMIKGGPGSGFHGHAGRPGEVGGSAPAGNSFSWDDGDPADPINFLPDVVKQQMIDLKSPMDRWGQVQQWAKDAKHKWTAAELGRLIENGYTDFRSIIDHSYQRDTPLTSILPAKEWAKVAGATWQNYLDATIFPTVGGQEVFDALVDADPDFDFGDLVDRLGKDGMRLPPESWRSIILRKDFSGETAQRFLDLNTLSIEDFSDDVRRKIAGAIQVTDWEGKTGGYPDDNFKLMDEFRRHSSGPKSKLSLYETPDYRKIEAGKVKDEVVKGLIGKPPDTSLAYEKEYEETNEFVKQWAITSNGARMQALGIQEAAASELGATLSDWQKGQIEKAKADQTPYFLEEKFGLERAKERIARHVKRVYEQTQAKLSEWGVDEVVVYRGMKDEIDAPEKAIVDIQPNALSSWSLSYLIADAFASAEDKGYVLQARVPAKMIYSTALTGPGSLREEEVILIGKDTIKARVYWKR